MKRKKAIIFLLLLKKDACILIFYNFVPLMRNFKLTLCFAVFLLVYGPSLNAQKLTEFPEHVSDVAVDIPVPYNYKANQEYKKIEKTSLYLPMKDGVKLAVNVYLPKGLKEGEKLPTILYQTRYWRAIGFRWPLNTFMEMIPSTPNFNMKEFVLSGYALVTVDVRGTGASYGTKDLTLPTWNEVQDGATIMDWIIEQPWSDGQVGATGISYIGITALYSMLNQHPALKAVAPLYSVFDLYDDIALPGGVLIETFLEKYGRFCSSLDQNDLRKGFLAKLLVKGVDPVDGPKSLYKAAFAEHTCNYYQVDESGSAEFINDPSTPAGFLLKYILSPHQHIEKFNNAGIPIYSYSGWWDLAFTHAAIKQYVNFTHPDNKLILGPWSHGGVINVDPTNPEESEFDHVAEVIKFFDYHLKDIDNSLDEEAPIHYYTMVEGKWKSSNTWPPEGTSKTNYYFSSNNTLSAKTGEEGSDKFITDQTVETGKYSRWNLSKKAIPKNGYPDRQEEDQLRLCYTSEPLSDYVEVTGHPVIRFYMTSSAKDVGVFAYLEDIDENGKVTRVTEGVFRALHKKLHDEAPHYKDVVPYHSYNREDAEMLSATEPSQIVFDMYPTSYLFKKGHKIRVAICGNDANFFKQITPNGTEWKIYHGAEYPSSIELPVMQKTLGYEK